MFVKKIIKRNVHHVKRTEMEPKEFRYKLMKQSGQFNEEIKPQENKPMLIQQDSIDRSMNPHKKAEEIEYPDNSGTRYPKRRRNEVKRFGYQT